MRQERVLIKDKLFAPYIQLTFAFYLRVNTKKKKKKKKIKGEREKIGFLIMSLV